MAVAETSPARANLAISGGLVALNLVQFFAIPLLLLPLDPAWGWLLILPILATTPLWSMIHEGIHGHLHPSRSWNDRLSRLLAILFGCPFQLTRLGHLMHHRFNRTPLNRLEVVETTPEPTLRERALYYGRLLGGLYVGEVLAAVLSLMPDTFYRAIITLGFRDELPDGRSMLPAARKQLLEEPGRSRMRLDGGLIVLLFGLSFWAYGEFWWMLALALAARGFLVSFFDNAYHYAAPLNDAMGGHDLRLPGWLATGILNFNYHATHHLRPNLPWTELPAEFVRRNRRFEDRFLSASLRQLEGPIPEETLLSPDRAA